MYSTTVTGFVAARPDAVYRVLLDPDAIARWRVPAGMTAAVHTFDAREGGRFRVSLTYDAADAVGKSSGQTDTYHGRFVRLRPDAEVVEELEFESDSPALAGIITMTTSLRAVEDGTEVTLTQDGVPDAVPRADNETGCRMALANLAGLFA